MFVLQFNLFKLSLEKAEVELKEADTAKKSVLDEQVSLCCTLALAVLCTPSRNLSHL
jgi:hypothetical protein